MRRFLVLQHMSWEGPGVHLIRAAQKCHVHLEVVEVWRQPIPAVTACQGMIVLGGSPNVNQEEEYHFLRAGKAAIRQVLAADKPYLGFCLGHQLLADALGARVGANSCRSVGFIEGQLTEEGRRHPLFRGLPGTLSLFKWHAQAVLLPMPGDVEVLAASPACQVEAISVKGRPHIVGLQFDNHAASRQDASAWLQGDRDWLSQPPQVNAAAVLADAERLENQMGEQFETLFRNFISSCLAAW
jgi:GMP synthase (glutamine-hydrolysing)